MNEYNYMEIKITGTRARLFDYMTNISNGPYRNLPVASITSVLKNAASSFPTAITRCSGRDFSRNSLNYIYKKRRLI